MGVFHTPGLMIGIWVLEIKKGGDCGVTIIVVGSWLGYPSSNIERGCLYFTYRTGMNSTILPVAMGN